MFDILFGLHDFLSILIFRLVNEKLTRLHKMNENKNNNSKIIENQMLWIEKERW